MKQVAIEFTYCVDIIEVPVDIARRIKKIQWNFDKWLYDKETNHNCWIIVNGEKKAVSFDSSDFVDYINVHYLSDRTEKARIVKLNQTETPENMPILFF